MENKVKVYNSVGLVCDMEPNDYALHALSKVLATQIRKKMSYKEALTIAVMLSDGAYEGEEDLYAKDNMYEIVAYFAMKHKIKAIDEALGKTKSLLEDILHALGVDKEQLIIGIAYLEMCGFINDWDNE